MSCEGVIESAEEEGRLIVADNGDVVANCRVDSAGASEGECFLRHPVERGQFLRTGLVCEIPEAFEADHALDVVAVPPAGLGMNAAAHGLVGEMGRFLICVGDEADISWGILGLHEDARGFEENGHGGNVVIRAQRARSRVIVRTENPVGFLQSAKVTRHGFEIVAIEVIDLESLARNAESSSGKDLLNEIRRTRKAGWIVAEISFFEGECFGDSKEASLEFAKAFRGAIYSSEKVIQKQR